MRGPCLRIGRPFGDPLSPMIKLAIMPDGSRLVAKFGRNVIVNDADGASIGWTPVSAVNFVDGNGNAEVGGSDIGYRGNYSGVGGEWAHAIAISPTDRNVIAVGQADLFISSSGGQPGPGGQPAWTAASSGHEDIQSLAFSADGNSLFIANDGGVFQLPVPPGNASPKDLNTKLTTAQFFRVGLNGKVAVGNADHQGIWGTTDIEASPVVWKRATPSDNGFGNNALENDFVSADPKTAGRFFVQFDSEHLLRLKFSPTSTGATQDLLPLNPTTAPLRPFNSRITREPAGLQSAQLSRRSGRRRSTSRYEHNAGGSPRRPERVVRDPEDAGGERGSFRRSQNALSSSASGPAGRRLFPVSRDRHRGLDVGFRRRTLSRS